MSAITPDQIAESLTDGDNDYHESLEGWFGLSATGNVVNITFSPARETEWGAEADKDNAVRFEAHVFQVPPTAPVAAGPIELPVDLARELTWIGVGNSIDGWTSVAIEDLGRRRWESDHRLVIRNEAGEHYASVYSKGLTENQRTRAWDRQKVARFEPVEVRKRIVEVVEYAPAGQAKAGGAR